MDFELLTRPTEVSEENEKEHVPDDPDPETSLSDSPSKCGKDYFTISDPEPLTIPTEFPEQNGKAHVADELEPDP